MTKHANCSSSVRDIRSMNFDEIPSFSFGLTQDENINLVSSNIQSKGGVILQELRSKQRNDLQNSVERMKWKSVRESLSPKSTKKQKSMKKRKSDEKSQSKKNGSPVLLVINLHLKKRKLRRCCAIKYTWQEYCPNLHHISVVIQSMTLKIVLSQC
ncbi:hypothetical protein P3L10_027044 [Capsicum annuum]